MPLRVVRPADLPLVDVGAFRDGGPEAREAVAANLLKSLREFNFFAFVNHDVPEALLDEVHERFRELYALPESIKRRHTRKQGNGYAPYGMEQALRGRHPDLKEMWHVYRDLPEGHPLLATSPVYGNNPWPEELPAMREPTLKLWRLFDGLADTLSELYAFALGLPTRTFADMTFDAPNTLRSVHYPPLPPNVAQGQERATAHTGAGMYGIISPQAAPGLEVIHPSGEWQVLEGFDHTMVVTLADMMELVSNGRLPANLHRVANPTGEWATRPRHALIYFVNARPEVLLRAPDALVDGAHPRLWKPIRARDFLIHRMTEVWMNRASPAFKLLWAARQTWRKATGHPLARLPNDV